MNATSHFIAFQIASGNFIVFGIAIASQICEVVGSRAQGVHRAKWGRQLPPWIDSRGITIYAFQCAVLSTFDTRGLPVLLLSDTQSDYLLHGRWYSSCYTSP
jgi:hypothetical protein